MNKQRKLKKKLKDGYRFEQRFSPATVERMLTCLYPSENIIEAATLQVGVVRLDAVLYWSGGVYQLGYDLMVKDTSDGPDWICYESLEDEVRYNTWNLEREMFRVLDRAVEQYGLCYTECRFPKLDGSLKQNSVDK